MNELQRAALRAAMQLGYPAFPCLASKAPACPTEFKDAALPEAGLATLWLRHPGELIGVPTGAASGLAVLDIDRSKNGGAWYAAHKLRLPATRIHRTRSGGLHLLFHHRVGLKCSTSQIAPGIDVRADGGYVIWWPAQGLEVRDAPLAEWPEWLKPAEPAPYLAVAQSKTPAPQDTGYGLEARLRGVARRVEHATEGERNSVTYWAACKAAELVSSGLLELGFASEVITLAAARAGLSVTEAKRTVASAFRGQCHG